MEVNHISNTPLSEQDMIDKFKIDTARFLIDKLQHKHRNAQQKDNNNNPVLIDMFGTTINAKAKHFLLGEDVFDLLKKMFEDYVPKTFDVIERTEGELMGLLINTDLHIDRMEHNKNYVKKIKDRNFELIDRMTDYGADHIVYVNLGDMYNTDGGSKTTKGTQQQNNSKEQDSFLKGLEFELDLTTGRDIAKALYVPGNHDINKMQYMADAVALYHRHNPNIEIDNSHNPRKYIEWGNNRIGFMHGDEISKNQLLATFAQETQLKKHNFLYGGHFHNPKMEMIGKLLYEIVGSPATPSDWEMRKGFVGQSPIKGIMFDKKNGKVMDLYG